VRNRGRVRVSTDHSVDFVLREGRVAALNFRRMQPGCVGGDARLLPTRLASMNGFGQDELACISARLGRGTVTRTIINPANGNEADRIAAEAHRLFVSPSVQRLWHTRIAHLAHTDERA
jgi:hypothetical protein